VPPIPAVTTYSHVICLLQIHDAFNWHTQQNQFRIGLLDVLLNAKSEDGFVLLVAAVSVQDSNHTLAGSYTAAKCS